MLAAALCVLTGCGDDETASTTNGAAPAETAVTVLPVGFELDEVTVTTPEREVQTIAVWVAESVEDRGRGLMGVTDLGDADGMLFVFGSEGLYRFFMWQTPMPLDIAFIAADGTVVGSAAMEPCLEVSDATCARYVADEPFLMALEVPAGALNELGIGPGTRISRA